MNSARVPQTVVQSLVRLSGHAGCGRLHVTGGGNGGIYANCRTETVKTLAVEGAEASRAIASARVTPDPDLGSGRAIFRLPRRGPPTVARYGYQRRSARRSSLHRSGV